MLGAIIGDFLVQAWDADGELPTDGKLPESVHLTALTLRVLGAAQGLRECDADPSQAADECAYWIDQIENECVHEGYDVDDEADRAESLCMEASPAGLAAARTDEAEQLAECILSDQHEILEDAKALAGAVCMACSGANGEAIANYVLSRELSPDSPVLAGAGALLKAESFEEAVEQALTHNLGASAAVAAACIAEPVYGIPDELTDSAWEILTPDLRTVADDFQEFVLTQHADR